MFSIFLVFMFVSLGVFLMVLRNKKLASDVWDERSEGPVCCFAFSIVFWIIAFIWFAIALSAPFTNQLSDFASVRKAQEQINLYKERRDILVAVVRVELAKYPEYEKKIMSDIKPQILLSFPTLKSNETIVRTVEEIIKLEDAVYVLRAELLETQRNIFAREISPWVLYITSYKTFFRETNPVAIANK